jgi:2-polyprenyl-3-methyl-5-hydroxy-6-metoxy-1,4-benzoquinol methylase
MSALEHVACNLCQRNNTVPFCEKDGYRIVRCVECGLIYVNPRINEASVPQLYAKEYFEYKGYMERTTHEIRNDLISVKLQQVVQSDLFKAVVRHKPGGTVLEIGCAEGIFLKALEQHGYTVQGVEISSWASEFARTTLGLQVLTGSLMTSSFPPGCFDIVYMGDVLEHLYDPLATLKKVASLLKSDGVFIANTPNIQSLSFHMLRAKWRVIAPERHLYYFSPASVRRAVEQAGLKLSDLTVHGFEWRRSLQALSSREEASPEDICHAPEVHDPGSFGARGGRTYALVRSLVNPLLDLAGAGDALLITASKL